MGVAAGGVGCMPEGVASGPPPPGVMTNILQFVHLGPSPIHQLITDELVLDWKIPQKHEDSPSYSSFKKKKWFTQLGCLLFIG